MQTTGYIDYPIVAEQAQDRRTGDRYLGWMSWVLLGYAVLGRGFAYVGVPPLFIGEVTLLAGALVLVQTRSVSLVFRQAPAVLLVLLMGWGLICTLPHVPVYGVDALRDAVIWGYGAFAVVVTAVLIQYPDRLKLLLLRYRTFATIFVSTIWAAFLLTKMMPASIPVLPGSPSPIVWAKPGDILVHLSGVTAFMLIGMMQRRLPLLGLLALCLGLTMVANRGGMVAFLLALMVVLLFRLPQVRLGGLAFGVALLLTTMLLINPKVEISGERTVSIEQLWTNIESVIGQTDSRGLEGTKKWRTLWWSEIVAYTFGGDYFLMGKGFGINLATADGYQVYGDNSLRSPHNGHLTMLARAGVPGFILWVLLQGAWGLQIFRHGWQARRRGDYAWAGVFVFLLAYWLAFLVNATFDVFLEGPMGGIWFWSLFGVGLAATHVYRHHPEMLDEEVGF